MTISAEQLCPASDSLLGQLYRASPGGLAALIETVPPIMRAALADYCSRRAHLESLGLAVAGTCTEDELYLEAGRYGRELFARAQAARAAEPRTNKSKKAITLATGPLWKPVSPKT